MCKTSNFSAICAVMAGGTALVAGVTSVSLAVGLASVAALALASVVGAGKNIKEESLLLIVLGSLAVSLLTASMGFIALGFMGANAFSTIMLGAAATVGATALGLGGVGPCLRDTYGFKGC